MPTSKNSGNRVVITGAGNISSMGTTWAEIKESFESKQSKVRYMHEWDQFPELKTRLAAPIEGFELPDTYRLKKKRSMGRVAQMAVRATELALKESGLFGEDVITNGETGVSFGSATGSSAAALEFFSLLKDKSMEHINTTTYIRMMSHTSAVNIGVYFGTKGRVYTTSSACTAGSQGIGYAYEAIQAGKQKVMIAGGAEELCPTQAAVFDTIFSASTKNDTPHLSPQPFDKDRDGLVLGEGASAMILESYDHAKERGANIIAEIIGYGTNSDGSHIMRPNQATMESVMQMSLDDAGVSSDQIGYVCAHATATEYGDVAESQATLKVLGKKPISSLKSYTGHGLGACGAFELYSTIMMMKEGWFAPTLNLENVDERCADLDYIKGDLRAIDTDMVMSNNFAFGGINTSLIVRKSND